MTPSKIAVTGGLGSGKSAFCALLKDMGYPVFSCDEINRSLWQDGEYLRLLAARFPACLEGGVPDRRRLADAVFADETARRALEELSHPLIMDRLVARMEECGAVCFAEVPLLFEGGYEGLFDAVIALRRDREARVFAARQRDGLSREQVLARMDAQFDARRLEEKRCVIVENDGSVERLREKACEALRALGVL